jgi:hypothetical protein
LPPIAAYHVFSLLLYMAAGTALFYAARVFCPGHQGYALLASACAVPFGLLTDHLPALEFLLRDKAARDQARSQEKRYQELLDKNFVSKGEFAHDIALAIQDGAAFAVPAYLQDAINASLAGPGEPDAAAGSRGR